MTTPAPLDLPALLDDLERAHAAATEGPWFAWNRGVGWHIAVENPEGVDHLPGRPELLPEGLRTDLARAEDAAAIAALHNAFPTLIAELRKRDAVLREFAELEASYPLGSDVPVYRIGRILAALSPESVPS